DLCTESVIFFFFQAEDGIRDFHVTGVQTCALPISGTVAHSTDGEVAARRMAVGMVLVLAALLVYVPWRSVGKYHHYRGMRPDIRSEERRVGKEGWSR